MAIHCTCGLSELRTFLDIRKLVRAGAKTYKEIADKLGLYCTGTTKPAGEPRHEYIKTHINLACLPKFVQAEYICMLADIHFSPVRWKHVARLYYLFNQEYNEYADHIGPKFIQEWERIVSLERG